MPRFSESSNSILDQVTEDLQRLFRVVIVGYDCKVLEAGRTAEQQNKLYQQGRTEPGPIITNCDGYAKVSKHQLKDARGLYMAVHVAPFPVNWRDTNRWYHFAGYVKRVAEEMSVKVRWGGDWDSDTEFDDQTLHDLVHWESVYPQQGELPWPSK
jgi:peptidoglycan L-alanyl-D-glutamate endopeptidase CwlK